MNKKLFNAYSLAILMGFIYISTLAPTYLWSDSAKLAIYVQKDFVHFNWDIHGVHTLLGNIFAKLPFEFAYTQNLMSAFFAVLGLVFVFLIILMITSNRIASFITAIILGVSQTYWHYAVINESYAVDIFFRAVCIWLVFKFNRENKFLFLYMFFFCFTFSLGNHHSHLLWLPGYLLLAGNKANLKRFTVDKICFAFIAFILGYIPLIAGVKYFGNLNWLEAFGKFFIIYYGEFTRDYFVLRKVFYEVLRYPFYLGYQFPFLSFFVGIAGAYLLNREKPRIFYGFFIFFLATLIPASGYYMKTRQFAMLLPTYLVFSLYLGKGMEAFLKKAENFKFNGILAVLIFILPTVILYKVMPDACKSLGVDLSFVRDLPYRDKYVYYFWPPKNKEYGAKNYAENALKDAQPGAVIISDFNPGMAILYVQEVLEKRKDILIWNKMDGIIHEAEKPVDVMRSIIEKYIHSRPVYLADIYEPYYFTKELKKYYNLVQGKALTRVTVRE